MVYSCDSNPDFICGGKTKKSKKGIGYCHETDSHNQLITSEDENAFSRITHLILLKEQPLLPLTVQTVLMITTHWYLPPQCKSSERYLVAICREERKKSLFLHDVKCSMGGDLFCEKMAISLS